MAVAEPIEDLGYLVVPAVHERDTPGSACLGGKHLPRSVDRIDVPVHSDDHEFGVRLEQGLRVASPAECRVDEYRARRVERGSEQREDTVEHGRNVVSSRCVHQTPFRA